MRIVRILNILVIVLFFALWIILLIRKEAYQGDGMIHPTGANPDSAYFSSKIPYGIHYQGAFIGFISQNKDNKILASGLWKTDHEKQSVMHFPFPISHQFDSLIAVLSAPDSSLTIVGLASDSIVKIIHFDSLVAPGLIFTAPADIKAVHYIKNQPEIVFGRQKKLVGSIASIDDTVVDFRKYELPGFFDRICEIVGAWPENDKWRFLLSTDFHQKDEKWILLGSKNKTNFLIFDERAVFPDFPGILNKSHHKVQKQFDYSISGLVPQKPYPDTLLMIGKNNFSEKKISKPKPTNCIWFNFINNQKTILILESDETSMQAGSISRRLFKADVSDTLPFITESGKLIIHQPGEPNRQQIFMSENEFPIAWFRLSKDSNIVLTNKLNFSYLSDDGRLLDRKNFFKLVNSTILRKEPGTIIFLDGHFPTLRALTWFVLLYGLIPIWIISLVIIWLIEAIRPKPKFAVRERKWPFMMRLMPGSVIYLIIWLSSIYTFLQSFAVFNF